MWIHQTTKGAHDLASVRLSFLALAVVTLLGACDDSTGVGGSVQSNSSVTSGMDPYPPFNLNGSLTGRVFKTGRASYVDLDTSEKVQLAGDSAYPSRDGLEVVELHDDVRFLPVRFADSGFDLLVVPDDD